MAKATVTRELNVGVDKVWAVLGDFGNLSWVEGPDKVESIGEGPGHIRRLFMTGLDPFDEILEAIDHAARSLTYIIPKNDVIPFDNYRSTVSVSGDDNSCTINWTCEMDEGDMPEADAEKFIEGNYNMLVDFLEKEVSK